MYKIWYNFSTRLGTFAKFKISLALKENTEQKYFKARVIAFSLEKKIYVSKIKWWYIRLSVSKLDLSEVVY